MAVNVQPTPNPNAYKFSVGVPVGGPTSYVKGAENVEQPAGDLLNIVGVTTVFMTADFLTLTKTPEAAWSEITPAAIEILEGHYTAD